MQLTPAPEKLLGCRVKYGQTQSLSLKMQLKKLNQGLDLFILTQSWVNIF